MTRGTLIVFTAGTHITYTGVFKTIADFKAWELAVCSPLRGRIDGLVYVWGGESQQYIASEVEEIVFGATDTTTTEG